MLHREGSILRDLDVTGLIKAFSLLAAPIRTSADGKSLCQMTLTKLYELLED